MKMISSLLLTYCPKTRSTKNTIERKKKSYSILYSKPTTITNSRALDFTSSEKKGDKQF